MFKNKSKKMIYRIILLILMDVLIITLSGPLAIYIRYNLLFESRAVEFIENIFRYLPINLVITIGAFYAFRLYQGIWKYASASDLVNILLACLVSTVTQAAGMWLMRLDYPRSYPFMYFFILAFGISVFRFMYRILGFIQQKKGDLIRTGKKNTMIVGAGEAGNTLLKELQNSRFSEQYVCCLVDDDLGKQGKYLRGVPVEGTRKDICRLAEEYDIDEIMIAIPSAIFSESFLAYLGLGIKAPDTSIGVLLADGQDVLLQYPYQTLFPAVLISLLMIAFNLFSNGLRDALDPTRRGEE